MIGPMGSGKTTLALKIAEQSGAFFQSLDGTIKALNKPIESLEDYENLMPEALEIMFSRALKALKTGQSVVFDVARWPWLRELAEATDSKIEIYYFDISPEVRWRRVQKRNLEKPEGVYHWTMSKEEFDAQDPTRRLPDPMQGLTLIKV